MSCCAKRIQNTEKRLKKNKVNPYKKEEIEKVFNNNELNNNELNNNELNNIKNNNELNNIKNNNENNNEN